MSPLQSKVPSPNMLAIYPSRSAPETGSLTTSAGDSAIEDCSNSHTALLPPAPTSPGEIQRLGYVFTLLFARLEKKPSESKILDLSLQQSGPSAYAPVSRSPSLSNVRNPFDSR